MTEVELERTFLAKFLPKDLLKSPKKEIVDIYLPANAEHAHLRIRKNRDKYTNVREAAGIHGLAHGGMSRGGDMMVE